MQDSMSATFSCQCTRKYAFSLLHVQIQKLYIQSNVCFTYNMLMVQNESAEKQNISSLEGIFVGGQSWYNVYIIT